MPWPSGLRRQIKALVRKGAGSNPAGVNPFFLLSRSRSHFLFLVSVAVAVARVRRCGQRQSKARRRDERRRSDARLFFSRNGTIGAPIQGRLGFNSCGAFRRCSLSFEKDLASRTLTDDRRRAKKCPLPTPRRASSARTSVSPAHDRLDRARPPSPVAGLCS